MNRRLPLFIITVLSMLVFVGIMAGSFFTAETAYAESFDARRVKPTPTKSPRQLPLMDPWWQPAPGVTWHWQLSKTLVLWRDVDMYDIDLFENDETVVNLLHNDGQVAIAYISAGSWEEYRPDADQFPPEVIGLKNGWPGERWLDIRRIDLIGPIMEARLDLAVARGFDGVELDNVDGYTNNTGFPLTAQDQLDYNIWLAQAAHARGLSVGLKNDVEQAVALEPYFDWAINEQCFQYHECENLLVFIENNKAVFNVEYKMGLKKFCPQANEWGFSSMRKRLKLNAWSRNCWEQ
jgi:hypothetical protein